MMTKQELDKNLDRLYLNDPTLEQIKMLYMRVFNTPDGQLVLRDLSRRSYTDAPVFDESFDSHRAAFKDGARSNVLHINTMIEPIERTA